jgi:hypothetical protein
MAFASVYTNCETALAPEGPLNTESNGSFPGAILTSTRMK